MDKIRRLQNGSDVRGVALEGEKGRTVDLTPPAVAAIAESFGEWVISGIEKGRGNPVETVRVSLGKDPRVSGAKLSVAVFAGLARAGCIVYDMGLGTTPACFMSTLLPPLAFDASIMMDALILHSSKSYYACVGESTHAYQSPSKDLNAINDRLNSNRKVRGSLNFDDVDVGLVSDSVVANSLYLQNGSCASSSGAPSKSEQPDC